MNGRKICQSALNREVRLLWLQHIYRTRFFIISTLCEMTDLTCVTNWLMQNPGDFAAMWNAFYSRNSAERLKELLTEHLQIGGDLVNAVKNGNGCKADALRKKWYENADEMAEFFVKTNPQQNKRRWTVMLYDHLRMTENEARLYMAGKYNESVAEFNNIETGALTMADYMTDGIVGRER